MRVHVVDPPAYTPPYDHALCAALAAAGADVELWTSRFDYGATSLATAPVRDAARPAGSPVRDAGAPAGSPLRDAGAPGESAVRDAGAPGESAVRGAASSPESGFRVVEAFYRRAPGDPGSGRRRAARLAQHVPDLLRYRRRAAAADVVHFQWLPVQAVDWALLPPRHPRLITAHDVLPRQARPGQRIGQRALYQRMDAVIVHSEHGAARLRDEAGVDEEKIHVIPHGVFHRLAAVPPAPLPLERGSGPVALCFGLMRPYKGLDVLLEAWRSAELPPGAELWMVGRPRMDVDPLRAASPPGVRWITRFVSDAELAALFRAADLAVLPYRQIDQSGVLYTALAFGTPLLLTAVGGFPEVARTGAAELVAPGDAYALAQALGTLLGDPARRVALAEAARQVGAPDGPYGWDVIARRTLELYAALEAKTT